MWSITAGRRSPGDKETWWWNDILNKKLYYTMVQPYLTYGIILWGSTYQSYLKRTVILQKKAIRYIHKAYYNAHAIPLFYASSVLNIHYTYLLEVAKCMHDFTRRKLPTPLLNFFSSNLTVHQHNTRQVLDHNFSIIYNSIAEKSIIHRGHGFGPTFLSL